MTTPKTIYLSGPMTGLPNHNFDTFFEVADRLQARGWKVINPALNFGGRTDMDRAEYMRLDFAGITKADAIAMLPGWRHSRGATAEYLVAVECGLEVYDGQTLVIMDDPPTPGVVLLNNGTQSDEPVHTEPFEDSGEKEVFESGAVRDDASDKPRMELISPFAEVRLGNHLRRGAEKYAPRNWEAGMPFNRCIASLKRHLAAYQLCDDSEDHLAAIMANSMFLSHYETMVAVGSLPKELDDRPLYHPLQKKFYGFAIKA